MGQPTYEAIEGWANGVVTALEGDAIPATASPRAYNSCLTSAGAGRASVSKRQGLKCMNATPITGSPAILGQVEYLRNASGVITRYHLLISDGGRLDALNTSTLATAAADSGTAAPFTSGTKYPDSAVANNMAFMCNGTDQKKFDGTTASNWGITRPSNVATVSDAGAGGVLLAGTYDAIYTYYNSNTGTESSASDGSGTVTIVANHKVTVNWTASADAQVTHVKVYIRETTTQPFYYLAATVAIGSTSTTVNTVTTSLTVQAPNISVNNPPPTTTVNCCWHNQRMFITDGVDVYFSNFDNPEQFDPLNILPRDGAYKVTSLFAFNGALLIGTEGDLSALVGPDPENWSVEMVDPGIGVMSHRSITIAEGVARWWSKQGPVQMDAGAAPRYFGLPALRPTLDPELLAHGEYSHVVAAVDAVNERVLFAVAEFGKTRNTLILPFNYRLGVWESDAWQSLDAASLIKVQDTDGTPWVYTGGYKGQVFRWWDATNDGVKTATTKSGTITGVTSTTLTDSGAAFDTTGGKLIERYVIAIDPSLTRVQRRRITANTGTELTIDLAWTDTPAVGWTYVVGPIDFQFDTAWMQNEMPFHRKRYRFLYLVLATSSSSVIAQVSLFFNSDLESAEKSLSLTSTSNAAIWDTGTWDTSVFGTPTIFETRSRVGKKGRSWRARIRNYQPDLDLTIHKIGMAGETLTDQNAR